MQKSVFKQIFLVAAIVLSVLPGLVMFGSILTSLFESMGWYVWIQEVIVPFESRLVAVLIRPLGIVGKVTSNKEFSMILERSGGKLMPVELSWNCLG